MKQRVLLTGGARSGKSRAAEQLLQGAAATYVATGPADGDDEWAERVARHRARRPASWRTAETTDVSALVGEATPDRPVLVDCLTLWLTARLDAADAWQQPAAAEAHVMAEIEGVAAAVQECPGGLVIVTNEVGSGIVPADPGTRLFRDLLGVCNATVAAQCDEVFLVVAGHLLPLQRALP